MAERGLAAAEYHLSRETHSALRGGEPCWQAPNRAQEIRTYFTPDGLRAVPRSESNPSWELSLTLMEYARGGRAAPVAPASLEVDTNGIKYLRGPISEWYMNAPEGVEQGFDLALPPEDSARLLGVAVPGSAFAQPGRPRDPVILSLLLRGTLVADLAADGQSVRFMTIAGAPVLHYSALSVRDARGRELPAWMETFHRGEIRGIALIFDDSNAEWPISVDPLIATEPDWFTVSNQAGAALGFAVASAGDVNGDGFSDVIVSAPGYDSGVADQGRVFVYHGSATGLPSTASWSVDGDSPSHFGDSVASAGDVDADGYGDVIVGAYMYSNGQTWEGRAYLYRGSVSGLSTSASWTVEGDIVNALFGRSVSAAGDVNGDGYSDVVVGAPFYEDSEEEGRAYVYLGSATGPGSTPAWTAEGDQTYSRFGGVVAAAGDVNGDTYGDVLVVAPARYYDDTAGAAFLFCGSGSGLGSQPCWTLGPTQPGAQTARGAGDLNADGYADIVVGSHAFTPSVFHGSASGPSSAPDWMMESESPFDFLYCSVGSAGDMNGDGYHDLLVGVPYHDSWCTDCGRVYVYLGSPTGLDQIVDWQADGPHGGSQFGWSSGSAGDVNGDDYSDVIVGAWSYDGGAGLTDVGRASVYHGSPRIGCAAGVSVTVTDDPDPIPVLAENLTFHIIIENAGPNASLVTVRHRLPDSMLLVSANPSQGSCTPQARVADCDLGMLAASSSATLTVVAIVSTAGTFSSTTEVQGDCEDSLPDDNVAEERTTVLPPAFGDRVWEDRDGDGVQDGGEPGIMSAVVYLFRADGVLLDVTFTDRDGFYRLPTASVGVDYFLRFIPPPGYALSPRDQGSDDELDSDADLATGNTAVFQYLAPNDRTHWDAGMTAAAACVPPDEAVYLYSVTLSSDGHQYPILHFMDPNQSEQVTGYNVRRSSDPSVPEPSWPLAATDVIDMDEGTPNKQWVDTSGDVSPTGAWYYSVRAYNHHCSAEGP